MQHLPRELFQLLAQRSQALLLGRVLRLSCRAGCQRLRSRALQVPLPRLCMPSYYQRCTAH